MQGFGVSTFRLSPTSLSHAGARSRGFHPWHDIPTGPKPPGEMTAVIEIPTHYI